MRTPPESDTAREAGPPPPTLLAAVVFAGIGLPVVMAYHYAVVHGGSLRSWSQAVTGFQPTEARVWVVFAVALAVSTALAWLWQAWLPENERWLAADNAGLRRWDVALAFGGPVLAFVLMTARGGGLLECSLALVISAAVLSGSRAAPRERAREPRPWPVTDEPPPEDPAGVKTITYRWDFRRHPYGSDFLQHHFTIDFYRSHYAEAEGRGDVAERPDDLVTFVQQDLAAREVALVAHHLREHHRELGLSRLDRARDVFAFVEAFRWGSPRDAALCRPRFPLETLFEQVGDGKDLAVLAAALLRSLGFEPTLFVFPADAPPARVVLGLPGIMDLPEGCAKFGQTRFWLAEAVRRSGPYRKYPPGVEPSERPYLWPLVGGAGDWSWVHDADALRDPSAFVAVALAGVDPLPSEPEPRPAEPVATED